MKQHQARKRFGQNFLTDITVIERIINSINPQVDDKLLEIGPGLGAITCPLLKQIGKLDVIELDRDIVPKLRINCGLNDNLLIHNCDVLKFDFNTLINADQKLRIIGNLPYNISTPIISSPSTPRFFRTPWIGSRSFSLPLVWKGRWLGES